MYLRTAIILDLHQPDGTRRIADLQQFSQRLNLADKVQTPGNGVPRAMTEINFGLHSALGMACPTR
jgi:hypothetical protein